jgi:hypothetical protein
MAEEPLPGTLPQRVVLLVTRLVIPERLLRLSKVLVQLRDFRVQVKDVKEHRVDFVRQQHPHFLADYLDAEGVDCPNDGLVGVLEGLQPFADVLAELAGDDSVERDDEHFGALDGESLGVQDPLDASHQAERFAAPWASDAPDDVGVGVNEGKDLRASDALVPRLVHPREFIAPYRVTPVLTAT